jgi:hypothetical protein
MTFLQHVGSIVKKVLHIGEEAATLAAPIINIAFPNVAPIYNSAIGLALQAEGTADSAQGKTGTQKLASALAGIEPEVAAWAKANGITWDQAEIQKWLSAVVDTLNMVPAPSQTSSEAPASSATPPAA